MNSEKTPQPQSLDVEALRMHLRAILSGKIKPTLKDSEIPRMSKEELKAAGMDTPRGYTRISLTGAAPSRRVKKSKD